MKGLKLGLALVTAGLLAGCASDGNVSNKSYLRAAVIGSDSVTMSFFSGEDEVMTVSADSPEEALSAAELRGGKKIFTGFTELVLLDGCDCTDTLERMLREWKVAPSCIVACPRGNGAEFLTARTAEELEGAVRVAQEQELIGRCDIVNVLGELLGSGSAEIPELSRDGFVGKKSIK